MESSGRHRPGPDRQAALSQYRRRAGVYDLELALFEPVRRRAVAWLAARPGDTVLDVGCGTGLSFEMLQSAVGSRGRIVGIEQSPEMIERARERVAVHGWRNVTLLCAPVESAHIRVRANAALMHFTHDILQRDDALENLIRHLRPGACVVASGLKWAPRWALPVNLFVLPAALRSVTSLAGLHKPWAKLAGLIGEPELRTMLAGAVYLARAHRGRKP
ncbi:MAG: class I SAM-dependent methyltransferase [Rubrivivax sp.]